MITALLLSLVAGLATVLGGAIAVGSRNPNFLLGPSLGFSAGAMVTVSLAELLPEALAHSQSPVPPLIAMLVGATAVIALSAVKGQDPAEIGREYAKSTAARMPLTTSASRETVTDLHPRSSARPLLRTGIMTFIVLTAHNVPEGFATFTGALQGTKVAIPLVAAIALHNIPEGLAIAAPLYGATASRARALWATVLSALAEPFGALVLGAILGPTGTLQASALIFGAITGVMVAISGRELVPASLTEQGWKRTCISGAIGGLVMLASLWALGSF